MAEETTGEVKETTDNFDTLSTFANDQGLFIKFDETNEPIEGLWLGYYLEDDQFNPGRQRVVYKLEIDQQEKYLTSSAKRLAKAVIAAKPEIGSFIRIIRIPGATQYDTQFKVETSEIPF